MSDWIKILKGFDEGKFYLYDYGLTMSLLVGASQHPIGSRFKDSEKAEEQAKLIFKEIESYNVDEKIVDSNPCNHVRGTVFKFKDKLNANESIGVQFDQIWNEYGDRITSGEFGITPLDLEIIKSILKRE
ncbi:conserved protein of unknown function [Tenacibaculum sp. 190524A02b]|uniref:hypothetical protein n=1 Tax=Tenacibaculum vairaonense TaxID=3137860 RepID=UPI0032B1A32F